MIPTQLPTHGERYGLAVQSELNGLLLGEKLGEGTFRTVYACPLDPKVVIKIETRASGRFCNVDEWNLWNAIEDRPEIARWFAPVRSISACGSVLVMERTQPIGRMPREVPNFMTDLKAANMGRLRGRPVFHDYANTILDNLALRRFKLVSRL